MSTSHEKMELKRGPWTQEEDQKLLAYIKQHGLGSWRTLPAKAGLQRCGKSCRLRWTNYLRPDIKRGKFSAQEEKSIIRLHALLGNRWSAIATHLPKRTDNEIKNYWNTRLKKRLARMGIDPATHKPKDNLGGSSTVVSHMAQWETARLEAEARLVREGKLLSRLQLLHRVASPTPALSPPVLPPAPPCLDVLKVWQASQNGFFSGAGGGCLESPTNVLSFSGNEQGGGALGCLDTSGVGKVNGDMQVVGKTENSAGVVTGEYSTCSLDFDLPSTVGNETMNCDGFYDVNSTSDYVGDSSYWNDLFDLVSSPVF